MSLLAVTRTGNGPPLVLLHGLGSSRRAWAPVMPALAAHFEVVAIDLPGFGDSPPLPTDVEPTPRALASAVADTLDELRLAGPPHVAGNSLGGWVALELAAIRPLASLTLLSPAGLWRDAAPRYSRMSLVLSRWLACHADSLLLRLVRHRLGRVIVLGQTHGKPGRLSADYARGAIRAMRDARSFEATLRASSARRYTSLTLGGIPVTLAFGSRDRLLLAHQSRILDELPAGVAVRGLPGCGHVPMADDPLAITHLIRSTAGRAPTASKRDPARAATTC